ncbi:threonine--tRNA ligase [Candidatus Beckwithbacteria bacterium CG22_combo_CG10-13_8_21_14_all_01_47_9]|uniref:Threonine--tRNA ligase n=7 Tax=Candidatus Beckwithiibacteriota TaxID=1752726 RepID=A0A2H0E0L3_9BACT|nr:MAG: threonine--tRNA ligase [Candidatus Beckwithbacteria bacterium CG22_combo_CG10-13_8_21_14_all_01_47_9]PJC66740.1 MAG: threonine--tRNA ligase [Candidatus Beckwithbacteria bacterium CG_4_9_14_0_2_um_filter_47_11]
MKQTDKLGALRHTAEHILHCAMQNLYPALKKAMGPATKAGFYFDFDLAEKISEADFARIEKEMQKLIDLNLPMKQEYLTLAEAKKLFRNNPYKLDWLDRITNRGEKISIYRMGEADVDLCYGPHAKSTGKIKAFKLLSIAGAYWHGDEKNKMLTRIYGTAFSSQPELDGYLAKLELAKINDHRKLGKLLELFTVSDQVGQGLILWLPKGNLIKEEVENWAKQTEKDWGYQRVTTPNIGKTSLYKTSGHLPYYKNDMYPIMKGGKNEEYILKPMNCPHHHQIYAAKKRSYKDLPLRLAEYGTCYRYEASGELFGMMRVRGFSQNDAHIYCTEEQTVKEFVDVMKLHQYYYKTLGINKYHLELALRDPKDKSKYHGNEAMWQKAEGLMRLAVKQVDIPMVTQIGNAAFYGPKIDFIVESSIGREFAISTNQIDLFMGTRFELKYTDTDGKNKTPVIIHRAPLGSHERFIGFLIEHFGGAFPLWLAPVQTIIVPISEKHVLFGRKLLKELKLLNLRVELDDRSESLGAKIRDAATQKIPYLLILGDKEIAAGKVAVRQRGKKDLGLMTITQFTDKIQEEIQEKKIQ